MNIRQLVERYCPVYYFHREEHYFPITFKFVGDCDKCLNTPGQNPDHYLSYKWGRSGRKGEFDKPESLVVVNNILREDATNKQYLTISYNIMYAYNGTIGEHYYDLEAVIYLFSVDCEPLTQENFYTVEINDVKPIKVYFTSHKDGRWYEWDNDFLFKIQKIGNTDRAKVFVSHGSHANYPAERNFVRFLGFGSDKTNKNTIIYDPIDYLPIIPKQLELRNRDNFNNNLNDSLKQRYQGYNLYDLVTMEKAVIKDIKLNGIQRFPISKSADPRWDWLSVFKLRNNYEYQGGYSNGIYGFMDETGITKTQLYIWTAGLQILSIFFVYLLFYCKNTKVRKWFTIKCNFIPKVKRRYIRILLYVFKYLIFLGFVVLFLLCFFFQMISFTSLDFRQGKH